MSIIPFPINPLNESARLQAIHFDRADLDDLAADSGSPEEWLTTAILHLKASVCEHPGASAGSVTVSTAAIHLVLMRLEELEHDGKPWRGGAS